MPTSFHTRHTESEYLDDVAYWLTEKLQSVCSRGVYVQNFTYTPDKNNDDVERPLLITLIGCAKISILGTYHVRKKV